MALAAGVVIAGIAGFAIWLRPSLGLRDLLSPDFLIAPTKAAQVMICAHMPVSSMRFPEWCSENNNAVYQIRLEHRLLVVLFTNLVLRETGPGTEVAKEKGIQIAEVRTCATW